MANLTGAPSGNHLASVRSNSEKKLGVVHYTSCIDFGWIGDIRKRYTDFIVHEVRKDGTVVYLSDVVEHAPTSRIEVKKESQPIEESKPVPPPVVLVAPEPVGLSAEDALALEALVGAEASKELQEAYAAIVRGERLPGPGIPFAEGVDRTQRGHIHQEIRRIFSGRFETQADPNSGFIIAKPAAGRGKRGPRQNPNGPNLRENRHRDTGAPTGPKGPYLHLTLYKENKDTMEAINHLARAMKMKSALFGFAGTKDRRAATTQRVSVKHNGNVDPVWLNSRNHGIKVGDFSYHKAPIQLGQHGGNEFTITIKNVELSRGTNCALGHRLKMAEVCVQASLDHIRQNGFINYFGLQRFGTHSIGTQEVGLKILGGDFESACNYILHVDPAVSSRLDDPNVETMFQRDEVARARAITTFYSTGEAGPALQILPRRFGAESTIIQHLGRTPAVRRDFCGALLKITRGLRNLYIHAYQSLVWNWVVSERWSKFGDKVIAGDLILEEPEANSALSRQGKDMSEDLNQDEEQFYQTARPVTAEEAASGKFSIFDIVLPVPGYDIIYPENEIGKFYEEYMGRPENGSLNPFRMRRPQKEFSLSGYYRKVMARFTATPQFFVRPYSEDEEQMNPTDLDEIRARKEKQAKKDQADAPAEPTASDSTVSEGKEESSRRRRLSPDVQPETRVNDAWLETGLDGGSKRAKIDQTKPASLSGNENVASSDAAASIVVDVAMTDAAEISSGRGIPSAEEVSRIFDGTPEKTPLETLEGSAATSIPTSGSASTLALPASSQIHNLFRSDNSNAGEVPVKKGGKAVNLTSAWRKDFPDLEIKEDMKIAVVLNFRLSSSNYATICMREMMSAQSFAEETAVSSNNNSSGNGQVLGHGGHVHQSNTDPLAAVSH